jgi:hypothetical protein
VLVRGFSARTVRGYVLWWAAVGAAGILEGEI